MKRLLVILLATVMALNVSAQKNKPVQKNKQSTVVTTKRKTVSSKRKTTVYSNASIRGLQGQRSKIQKKIKEQEQALRKNQTDVKQRLQTLITLNTPSSMTYSIVT